MCERCVCPRCGAPAVGQLPDGTMFCEDCYRALFQPEQATVVVHTACRRCREEQPPVLIPVAHGLALCGPCHAWYHRLRREAVGSDMILGLVDGHPELSDVAEVYQAAAASGIWDSWL